MIIEVEHTEYHSPRGIILISVNIGPSVSSEEAFVQASKKLHRAGVLVSYSIGQIVDALKGLTLFNRVPIEQLRDQLNELSLSISADLNYEDYFETEKPFLNYIMVNTVWWDKGPQVIIIEPRIRSPTFYKIKQEVIHPVKCKKAGQMVGLFC